jgi:hypothetical protein
LNINQVQQAHPLAFYYTLYPDPGALPPGQTAHAYGADDEGAFCGY